MSDVDYAAVLLRAARAAARQRAPIDDAMEQLLAAAPHACTSDLERALRAAHRLPQDDVDARATRQLLTTAVELQLFNDAT